MGVGREKETNKKQEIIGKNRWTARKRNKVKGGKIGRQALPKPTLREEKMGTRRQTMKMDKTKAGQENHREQQG